MDDKRIRGIRQVYSWAEKSEGPGGNLHWYAQDTAGNIAAFLTGGQGPVPDQVFSGGFDEYLKLYTAIEEWLSRDSCESGDDMPWYTERGLFVYETPPRDSIYYQLEGVPAHPITFDDLKSIEDSHALLVAFPDRFESTRLVIPHEYWRCR